MENSENFPLGDQALSLSWLVEMGDSLPPGLHLGWKSEQLWVPHSLGPFVKAVLLFKELMFWV